MKRDAITESLDRLKKILFIVLPAVVIIFVSGCQAAAPRQHINFYLSGDPGFVDPAQACDQPSLLLANALYEGLVRLKADGTYEQALAESWDIENDGLRYVFHLRESYWETGERVTAYDFEFSWVRALNPAVRSPYAYLFYDIKNAEEYNCSEDEDYYGEIAGAEDVGIKARDEDTLVVELENSNPVFINKLAHPIFFPLPKKAFADSAKPYFQAGNYYTNGSFVLTEYKSGDRYELKKNGHCWDSDNVRLESMTWLMTSSNGVGWHLYRSGKADVLIDVPLQELAKGIKDGIIKTSPLLADYSFLINTAKKPLNDSRVRRALSLALNRSRFIEEVLQGGQTAALGIVPEGAADVKAGSDFRIVGGSLVPDNDPGLALSLLAEAGYPEGRGFPELELLTGDQPGHKYLAEALQEIWREKLGIQVKVTVLGWQEKALRTKTRKYDLALGGWTADYADPVVFLERYLSKSGSNDTGWKSGEFDSLLKAAAASFYREERFKYLHEAERLIAQDLPVLPLYNYTRVYAVKPKVKGLYFPTAGAAVEFKWAYLE